MGWLLVISIICMTIGVFDKDATVGFIEILTVISAELRPELCRYPEGTQRRLYPKQSAEGLLRMSGCTSARYAACITSVADLSTERTLSGMIISNYE